MNIGVDIDGVLANFTDSYAALLTKQTGIIFPKNSSTWPTEWYWDRAAGVQKPDENAVWDQIKSSTFWLDLAPLPGAEDTLQLLSARRYAGDQIYFITTRPGLKAKLLTEFWLRNWGFSNPTVLIAGSEAAKGQLASALKLDLFIDDKPENCEAVLEATKKVIEARTVEYPCKVCLVNAPYNQNMSDIRMYRVASALAALTAFTIKETLDAAIAA